ncbi:sugar ABC transporter ATP-binding protein [Arthrobacter mobilis]|uniref:Sugar ABC transporter ATP-binding protein n=1 Tax=Arthrobacter mobilis TaxID=2724944 RepID=A0A7X6HEV3_9MICC|nr:sugar ABC transporter ATP-binding protein [Arthrobacter mobilis]NKX54392.1 sugar ABC transporter ATP-binding protein [Arthrobacter mobilis]
MTASVLPETSVELLGLTKDFGINRVLNHVNLKFQAGTIHALLGANGSGKSTLIKILAGYHVPTSGAIRLHGEDLALPATPRVVHDAGVRFVHQDLGLVSSMSVADNLALALGYERKAQTISWRKQREAARRDLAAVGLEDVDPDTTVKDLGPVQQTLVAMARAIRGLEPGRGVLVLDEPTARLPNAQVDELLDRCRALRDQGVALIYVSHRLDEVFAMADKVTVLRDGNIVFDDVIGATNEDHLTAIITGRTGDAEAGLPAARAARKYSPGPAKVRLRGVCGTLVKDIDLDLHRGEVLAVTGLIGSGRSELGRLIFGTQKITAGTVEHNGQLLQKITPESSIGRGIGYVPQDRRQAAVPGFNLADNLCLAGLERHMRKGFLSRASQRRATRQAIQDLDVRPADPDRTLKELSGGNQQKVILGKWLQLDLDVLILDEPTYGVDVGARTSILASVLERVAASGLSVLLLDSDIDLVAEYADRVLVMRRGQIVKELSGDDITVDGIAAASYAVQPQTPDLVTAGAEKLEEK